MKRQGTKSGLLNTWFRTKMALSQEWPKDDVSVNDTGPPREPLGAGAALGLVTAFRHTRNSIPMKCITTPPPLWLQAEFDQQRTLAGD